MRLGATKTGATTTYNGLGDQLYDNSGARPTLDLNFASNGSLVDSVTGKTLVTHTRASNATYVDGDGIIKDAVTNINLHSTMNTSYVSTNTDGVYETDQITAPDGTLTGNKFTEASTTAGRYVRNNYTQNTFTSGKFYLLSVYLKEGDNTNKRYAGLIFPGLVFSTNKAVTFNLTGNGTATPNSGSGEEPAVYGIESVGNGWYRCWIGATATVTSTMREQYRITDTSNNAGASYAGDGSSHIFMWGTQLEELNSQQSTPGEYVKTTSTINSAPRFDHNPTTGESLGLLVEESRTNLVTDSEDVSQYTIKTHIQYSTDQVVAPDGTTTADKIYDNTATAEHYIQKTLTAGASGTFTHSIFVKAAEYTQVYLRPVHVGESSSTSSCVFDLSNETATTPTGLGSNAAIEKLSNGWYRVSMSVTLTGASTTNAFRVHLYAGSGLSYEGDGASGIYVWGGQVEAGSFPTSYIRTTGTVGVRAADVTSIEGNDFGTFNLVQYSEEFDNSSWIKGSSVTISANDSSAPDGTVTADKVESAGTTASANQCIQFLSPARAVVSGDTYTFSVYLRADAPTTTKLRLANIGDGDGSLDTVSVTTEWQRFETTRTFTGSSSNIRCVINYQSDAVTVYAWGAQLEESSTATPYVKSDVTFTSRGSTATYYDYNGIIRTAAVDEARNVAFLPDGSGNFVSAGELLLEDAGTNLLLQSEDFSTSWNNTNDATVSTNQTVAPDGNLTGDLITADATNAAHNIFQDTAVGSGSYTFSCYIKANGYTTGALRTGLSGNFVNGNFDLTAGTISISTAGTAINGAGDLIDIGNGWFRCWISASNIGSGSSARNVIYLKETSSFLGDGTSGLYIWGAQLETGSYPTSYIPTYGSTATRAADVSSSSSNTFGNSFYNQTEGTVAVRWNKPWGGNWADYKSFFVVKEAANPTQNAISFGSTNGANNQIYWSGKTSNVSQFSYRQYPASGPGSFKHAIAVASNDAAFAHAGAISGRTDDSVTLPTVDKADIDAVNSHIFRLTYWPTRLNNDTLETITV